MMDLLLLLVGLVLLVGGAEALVRGGAALALRLGLTPLLIGLTVIAYGTSSPEVVVSASAATRGDAALAIGNAVGSNLCNIGLILGLCALIKPLHAASAIARREVPLMIAATCLAVGLLADGHLGRLDGVVLLVALVAYTLWSIRCARREAAAAASAGDAEVPRSMPLAASISLTIGGLVVLVLGAGWFVDGAVHIAARWGVSEVVIGLTIVAVGTSLPELATSLAATRRGEVDVALGNVIGSNVFNLLGILGLVGLLGGGATGLNIRDLAMLLGITIVVLPMVRTGGRITRWEGAALLAAYVTYTAWMVVQQGRA